MENIITIENKVSVSFNGNEINFDNELNALKDLQENVQIKMDMMKAIYAKDPSVVPQAVIDAFNLTP